jgi:hypothetical protein
MAVAKKLFTPAEAEKMLPLVRSIVRDILERGRALREAPDGYQRARAARELRELTRELTRLGCDYKDWSFEHGLVDFPAEIDGQPVLLCWRSDEPRIAFYHEEDAGFAGRKPIPPGLVPTKAT